MYRDVSSLSAESDLINRHAFRRIASRFLRGDNGEERKKSRTLAYPLLIYD